MHLSLSEFIDSIERSFPKNDVVSICQLNVVCDINFGRSFTFILGEFMRLVGLYDEFNIQRLNETEYISMPILRSLGQEIVNSFFKKNEEAMYRKYDSFTQYLVQIYSDIKVEL